MSKASEAKALQGYVPKLVPATCGNCRHYLSTITRLKSDPAGVGCSVESNRRCGLGGFAVKKLGWCREYQQVAEK